MLLGRCSIFDNYIGSFLAHCICRESDEEAGDLGESRRINDPQPLDASDAELAIEDSQRVAVGANRGRARSMVAPGLIPGKLAKLVGRADVFGWPHALKGAIEGNELVESIDAIL